MDRYLSEKSGCKVTIEAWVEVIPPFVLPRIRSPHVAISATHHGPETMLVYM